MEVSTSDIHVVTVSFIRDYSGSGRYVDACTIVSSDMTAVN